MYCLTIWQPYAQLIADGVKDKETRSWTPSTDKIGQTIAIHAAKRRLPKVIDYRISKQLLYRHGFGWAKTIPFGAVIATARLAGCYYIDSITENRRTALGISTPIDWANKISPTEIPIDPYGDYSVGRYAWVLEDIEKLDTPIPIQGEQRLWQWKEATEALQKSRKSRTS